MSRSRKPFEQYRTQLEDGRSVVEVSVNSPRPVTLWVVAGSRTDALAAVRVLGAAEPRVSSSRRPAQRLAELAAQDPAGIVFGQVDVRFRAQKVFASAEFADYMAKIDSRYAD